MAKWVHMLGTWTRAHGTSEVAGKSTYTYVHKKADGATFDHSQAIRHVSQQQGNVVSEQQLPITQSPYPH